MHGGQGKGITQHKQTSRHTRTNAIETKCNTNEQTHGTMQNKKQYMTQNNTHINKRDKMTMRKT